MAALSHTMKRLSYNEWRGSSPHVHGYVEVWDAVYSPQLDNHRPVVVYLPPSYAHTDWRYPVVYMHDGQNLFDPTTSSIGVEWQVDETMERLSEEGIEAIIVGVWNTTDRASEYSPFPNWFRGRGERYVQFLTETLKPLIDAHYRTAGGRRHTGILGSSMGGLISLYAAFVQPDVFGFVGAMSPSLWVGRGAICALVEQAVALPDRVYLDHGTREASPQPLCEILQRRGYVLGVNLLMISERGGTHNEAAWARRLPGAMRFLLTPLTRDVQHE